MLQTFQVRFECLAHGWISVKVLNLVHFETWSSAGRKAHYEEQGARCSYYF